MSAPSKFQTLGKVVVVGGCGFLGSHIVSYIVKRHPQTQIAVLDLRTNSNRHTSSTVSYHDGDITDLAAMQALFAQLKPDAVIHTASPHFNLPPAIHDKVNVQGTKNLLKASQDAGVKAFVYTSSASVIFGGQTELVNANEEWPLVTGDEQPEYYTTTKVRTNCQLEGSIANSTHRPMLRLPSSRLTASQRASLPAPFDPQAFSARETYSCFPRWCRHTRTERPSTRLA